MLLEYNAPSRTLYLQHPACPSSSVLLYKVQGFKERPQKDAQRARSALTDAPLCVKKLTLLSPLATLFKSHLPWDADAARMI